MHCGLALIDAGVDCNVISYDTWVSMGKPILDPCQTTFKGFSSTQTSYLGKIYLKVRIQTEAMHANFYVADKNHKVLVVLLGHSWMCSTNCQINLRTREYMLEVNYVNLTWKDTDVNLQTTQKKFDQTTPSTPQGYSKPQQKCHSHNQVRGRGELTKLFY